MNIFKKLFKKKVKENNTDNNLLIAAKKYFENQYQDIEKQCKDSTITYYGAKSIFRHYPLRYDSQNENPEEINMIIDKIFKTLYNYCIEKKIIASDITYEDFYKGKGLYDESYPLDIYVKKQ